MLCCYSILNKLTFYFVLWQILGAQISYAQNRYTAFKIQLKHLLSFRALSDNID